MKKKDTKWMVVLLVVVILLLGVACYLHLDCRNLEALLADGKGTEAEVLSSSSPTAVTPTLGGMPTPPSATVAPSVSVTEQLEELRTELAEAEAERERLEQKVTELKGNFAELLEENAVSMSELEELDPEAYAAFAEELRDIYANFRQRKHIQHYLEELRMQEDMGVFPLKPSERQRREEYFSRYQEYVDGVLDNVWSEAEANERYRQLNEAYSWMKSFGETINQALVKSLEVKGLEEQKQVMQAIQFSEKLAREFTMTPTAFFNPVLQKRLACEMLEQDCPPLDYGLAPGEEDEEVRQLEEWMSYWREHP